MVRYNSTIERDMIYWLDYAELIATFKEQPFPIYYNQDGKKRRYTVDFYVETIGGKHFLIECKPASRVSEEINQNKFSIAEEYCAKNSMEFVVVTEEFLRTGHWLQNVKNLTLYSRYEAGEQFVADVKNILLRSSLHSSFLSLEALSSILNPEAPEEIMPYLYSLLYHHEIYTSIFNEPISRKSCLSLHPEDPRLWLPKEGN